MYRKQTMAVDIVENSLEELTKKKRSRLVELAIGLTANQTIDYLFDYALYPFVIYRFGILWGGLVMMVLSFIACLLSVWFYDWSKCDWLGIEAIKSLKGYSGDKKLGRLTGWLLRKSDSVVFLFLSIKYDSFITMTYMRHGSHQYNGMSQRDWRIFLGSVAISNAYWTLAAYMGISVVEWIWRVVKSGWW